MTEDTALTLLSKNTLPMVLIISAGIGLAACSSKPAPWAESSSPWEHRGEESGVQPIVDDTMAPLGDEIEPDLMMAIEQETMPEPVIEMDPVMVEEPMSMPVSGSLAQQPAHFYAVQVVASGSQQQVSEFARRHQLSDEWVAETNVGGRTWYVLMLGVYPTKGEAEQALGSVRGLETQPWIRTVGSIQSVMN